MTLYFVVLRKHGQLLPMAGPFVSIEAASAERDKHPGYFLAYSEIDLPLELV